MSIDRINKVFQNKGCNLAMSIVLGIAVITMLGTGFKGCAAQRQDMPEGGQTQGPPVATVGDLKITRDMIDNQVEQQMQQFGGVTLPESYKTRMAGSVLNQLISNGLAYMKAKNEGVDFSDGIVKQYVIRSLTDSARQSLMMQGKLQPNASEQDFENAYKAVSGKSFLDDRKSLEKTIDEKLANPATKVPVDASLAFQFLVEKEKGKHTPTDAQIKDDFYQYHFKQIDVTPAMAGKQKPKEMAQKILAEIKGGLSFEKAMEKYIKTKPPAGKKVSDVITDLPKSTLAETPGLKPLLSLKAGQVSDVIEQYGEASIYKLVSEGLNEKDFSAQKSSAVDRKAREAASKALTEEIKTLDTPQNVKWDNEGYHVLHDYAGLESGTASPDRNKKLLDIIKRALDQVSDPQGGRVAVATAMSALTDASAGLPADQAKKLKVQVLSEYVKEYPELDAKIQLAEAYIDSGDAENTYTTLKDAAEQNAINTDASGKQTWDMLNKNITKADAKKLLKPEELKDLKDAYAAWRKEYDSEEATRKATEAELKKNDVPAPGTTPPSNPANKPAASDTKANDKKPADKKNSGKR